MLTTEAIQRYKGKSVSWLIDKAQTMVNAYIRKRDSAKGFFICISCQELKPSSQMNAGHYFEKTVYKSVRFDTDNIAGQCIRCNKYLSGNLIPYRENLIKKIGVERFERLEQLAKIKGYKYDRYLLIDIIERFKKL